MKFYRSTLGLTTKKTPIEMSHSHALARIAKLRPILWMGGIHGDEPEGVELAKKTQFWLEEHSDEELVPWVVIPCLNPDGFAVGTRVNGRGVDLNRNYPASNWSPEHKASRYYPGAHPGSEPEIASLCQLISQISPRLIVHCHSWQPCIVATGPLAKMDGERLAQVTGYALQETIGYDTPGSLSQYGWHDYKIPVICIEEQEGVSLPTVWPRFAPAIQEIFRHRDKRK